MISAFRCQPYEYETRYEVVTPREDLREGKPLDAAEFPVHLDHVRNNCAPPGCQVTDY